MDNIKQITPSISNIKTGTPGYKIGDKHFVGGIGGNFIPGGGGSSATAGYLTNTNGIITFTAIDGLSLSVSSIYIPDTGQPEPAYTGVTGILFNGKRETATSIQVIPDTFTSALTNFYGMFSGCTALITINLFDTSNGANFGTMFYNCSSITSVPLFNTSNGTNFQNMFTGCTSLITAPQLDVSSAPNVSSMFSGCTALTTVPQLNVVSATSVTNIFSNCSALINFGGLLNCKKSYSLSNSTSLTHDSLVNAINGLADLTGQTSQRLTIGSTNLAKLTAEEIAVATNKNWTVA